MNSNTLKTLSTDEIHEILVKRIDQQKKAVGIVVGIIDPNGRRIIAHGKLAQSDPRILDGDTIFEIGSITKVFTSLLLADMVSRNEVALDDPAANYLPEHVKLPERDGKSITLRDLSMHTSGLPRIPTNLNSKDPANPYAGYGIDGLYQFLSTYTLPRDPGSEIEYSNLGGGLLGHLLTRRAGTDYETLIRTRITQPLGMPDTAITLSPSMNQRMATGHNMLLSSVPNWDFPTLAGAGALRSSANDILTFLEAFLGYKDSPLAPAMKSMLDVRRSVNNSKFAVALGWNLLGETVWHDGGTGGFCSFAGYDPQARLGVIVLSNAFAMPGIADIGIHLLNPKVPLANPEPPPQRTEIRLDTATLDRYTGRYQWTDRIFEITHEGDHLFLQVIQTAGQAIAAPKFELFSESEKSFFSKMTGSQIIFETDSGGRATSLTMHRPGREPTLAARLS